MTSRSNAELGFRGMYQGEMNRVCRKRFRIGSTHYDLAAHILQRVSGIPFEKYITERILSPLGMLKSTLDQNDFHSNTNRAIGHMIGIAEHPNNHGFIGAGKVFLEAFQWVTSSRIPALY